MKDFIIIGSVAMHHWDKSYRVPKNDIDILCTPGFRPDTSLIPLKYQDLRIEYQEYPEVEWILNRKEHGLFMIPEELFALKLSHSHWDIKWEKTIKDISWMKEKGYKIDLDLYYHMLPVWERIHGSKSKINLNKSVEDFFNDNVKRKYNHEELHELVKFNEKPMHEYIRKDHKSVLTSEVLFTALPYEHQRIQTCLEEILVTAIERFNLTKDSTDIEIRQAVIRAHKKLCTSMTKGYFSRYLILNSKEILIGNKEILRNKAREVLFKLK